MKKISMLLALAGTVAFGQMTLTSTNNQEIPVGGPVFGTEGVHEIIVDQPNDDQNGIISDIFLDIDGSGVYSADDFDMPFTGKITSLTAVGFNNGGNFMNDTLGVVFYLFEDDGGMWMPLSSDPEVENLYRFEVYMDDPALSVEIAQGTVRLSLDLELLGEDVILQEGEKYWFSCAPMMDGTDGEGALRWNWYVSSVSSFPGESQLIDPDDLFGEGMTEWTGINGLTDLLPSLAMTIEGTPALGLNEVSATASIMVYPNPATNFVKVQLKGEEIKEMSVFSLEGKKVATTSTDTVRVTSLPVGTYVVKVVDTKGTVYTSKIVKK